MNSAVSNRHLKVYFFVLISLIIPFSCTLSTVQVSMTPPSWADDPTPLGYTLSLLIFLVPWLMFVLWLAFSKEYLVEKKAYFGCVLGVFLLGSFLDFVFGYSFFTFPNRDAVIGLRLPSFSFTDFAWIPRFLPIEEFGFYLLGAAYMISLYLWGVMFWFSRYNHKDHKRACSEFDHIIHFNFKSFKLALLLCVLGLIVKKFGPYPDGFPGYYFFLILLALLPCMLLYSTAKHLINWRAFSFMSFMLLLVSIVYEATLGVPYGWWRYQKEQMLGIFIDAWSQLPIEAVFLWVAASFGTVLLFEALRIYFYLDKPLLQAFIGRRGGK